MARTPIAISNLGRYGDPQFVVPALTDGVNEQEWIFNQGDMLLIINTHASTPVIIILVGAEDAQGRVAHGINLSLLAGEMMVYGPLEAKGWLQVDGKVWIDQGVNDSIKFTVLRGAH